MTSSWSAPALPQRLRRPAAVVSPVAALVVVILGLIFAGHSDFSPLDRFAMPIVENGIRGPLRPVALAIDFCAEPVGAALVLAALVAVCLALGNRRVAVLALAGPGAAAVLASGLKPVVGREIHGEFLSYPSGHTAFATAVSLVVVLLVADRVRTRGVAVSMVLMVVVVSAAMAWSQVTLGAHYPTDTVGGFCVALAVVPATAWVLDLAAERTVSRV